MQIYADQKHSYWRQFQSWRHGLTSAGIFGETWPGWSFGLSYWFYSWALPFGFEWQWSQRSGWTGHDGVQHRLSFQKPNKLSLVFRFLCVTFSICVWLDNTEV